MRVIAGKAKGRKLIAPEGLNTRPIMAKMKEALFSMWQFDILMPVSWIFLQAAAVWALKRAGVVQKEQHLLKWIVMLSR